MNHHALSLYGNLGLDILPKVSFCVSQNKRFEMTWERINYETNPILRQTSPLLQHYSLSHLSMRTRAGMPPDLKMASSPSRWCERLCRMLAVARVVSMSDVFCMALTTAATICGDCIRARRDASLRVSWFTIIAALFTTTWSQERESKVKLLCLIM